MGFNFPLFSVIPAILLAYLPHFTRVFILFRSSAYDNKAPRAYGHSKFERNRQLLLDRLLGAHNNQLELLGAYAAGVAANIAMGKNDNALIVLCSVYIGARILWLIAYVSPQAAGGFIRTAFFAPCLASVMLLWGKAAIW